ncbi:MAG: dipicolinic acid synthetase [Clostridia bacterium]|nr:dipicolinic acid synthetase [Clostridia bacterium]
MRTFALGEASDRAADDLAEAVAQAQAVVLPLPCTKDETYLFGRCSPQIPIDRLAALLRPEQLVLGGMLTASVAARLQRCGCRVIDYYKREEITVRNVVPTVQGILKQLLGEIDYTVSGSSGCVCGYGRVGRATARTLKALGAHITVCARSGAARALAETEGCDACDFLRLPEKAAAFDYIINTVPAPVIGADVLRVLKPSCLILDVASAPYGTDFAAAERFGVRALQCACLPGKAAPKTAGEILAQGILHLWEEEGYV